MQCRFPMLYQGADERCDPATKPAGTPDQNAAPKRSACTFEVGRLRCAMAVQTAIWLLYG